MANVELRDGSPFPVDVHIDEKAAQQDGIAKERITHISAYDFADIRNTVRFGTDKHEASKTLRRLADEIDANLVLVQRAQVTSEAINGDYPMSVLILEFHRKKDQAI